MASERAVLELVVFKLKEGATREQFEATVDPVSRWVGDQPGFVSRELSYDAEGDRWIDLIWWASMEQAGAAAERAMTSETCAPMFALLDMEDTQMLHGRLVHSFGAVGERAAA